jgi:hypothetical protein
VEAVVAEKPEATVRDIAERAGVSRGTAHTASRRHRSGETEKPSGRSRREPSNQRAVVEYIKTNHTAVERLRTLDAEGRLDWGVVNGTIGDTFRADAAYLLDRMTPPGSKS